MGNWFFRNPRIILLLLLAVFAPACTRESSNSKTSRPRTIVENPVNINTESLERLSELDGIGPARAERIIEFRKEFGRFERKEELMLVEGIGEKLFLKVEMRIIVR